MVLLNTSFRSRNCLLISVEGTTESKCQHCSELVEQIRKTSDFYQKLKYEAGELSVSDICSKGNNCYGDSDGDEKVNVNIDYGEE